MSSVICNIDFYSTVKKGYLYAKSGDELELLSDYHYPVLLVKNISTGVKFTIHKDFTTIKH